MAKLAKTLKGLFSAEDRWCKGAFKQKSPETGKMQFCLLGGLRHVYGTHTEKYDKAYDKIVATIPKVTKKLQLHNPCIMDFNDAPRRKFSTIQKLVNLADV